VNRRRRLKESGKRALRLAFEAGQHLGVDVLPRHFYSEIPDLRELRASDEWRRPRSLRGIAGVELEGQREFIRACATPDVLARLAGRDIHGEARAANATDGYGPIEASFLYCVIAARRPPRVVQVGAGVSTAVILAAAAEAGAELELTCVDPFPSAYLRELARAGRIELIAEPVQRADGDRLADVGPSGLLFVDSTHTVRPGGDVNHVVLELLPAITAPSLVHFHDIFLPYDYSPTLLESDLFFWSETALVTAFLTGNPAARVLAALSMVHRAAPEAIAAALPWYRPAQHAGGLQRSAGHFPSSLYFELNGPAPAPAAATAPG
jgi:hypothetical protein